jgi:hypothetical protein
VTIEPDAQPPFSQARPIASLRASWRARSDAADAVSAGQSLPRFALRQLLPWVSATLSFLAAIVSWGGRDWKVALVALWVMLTLDLLRTIVVRHRARARLRVFPVRGPDG